MRIIRSVIRTFQIGFPIRDLIIIDRLQHLSLQVRYPWILIRYPAVDTEFHRHTAPVDRLFIIRTLPHDLLIQRQPDLLRQLYGYLCRHRDIRLQLGRDLLIACILQHRFPGISCLMHRIHTVDDHLHERCGIRNLNSFLRTIDTLKLVFVLIVEHQLHREVSISPCTSLFIDQITCGSITSYKL
ncbi:hypothetical protein HMPREF0983_04102 [Erysipelotrichaceae bacterium 3_1_53]|nr:hypothetical protein HMPREF0983_04102 [Erysipelotrichaceae bacterium 3_1_53]